MEFTPPASGSTRLSADVWQLICNHAMKNGNSSTREALEQLVRQALGSAQPAGLNYMEPVTTSCNEALPTALSLPSVGTAAAALDALLMD